MDIQVILDAIKDYGAAAISTIGAGGVAAVVGLVAKIKSTADKSKQYMESVIAKKDSELKDTESRYNNVITVIEEQNKKIEQLTEEVSKVKKN